MGRLLSILVPARPVLKIHWLDTEWQGSFHPLPQIHFLSVLCSILVWPVNLTNFILFNKHGRCFAVSFCGYLSSFTQPWMISPWLDWPVWVLQLQNPAVRKSSISALQALYAVDDHVPSLSLFTARFCNRMVEMADDVDMTVAVNAIGLLKQLLKWVGSYIWAEKDIVLRYNQVLDFFCNGLACSSRIVDVLYPCISSLQRNVCLVVQNS